MNKTLKILLIIFVIGLVGGIIAFMATGNTANAEEYKLGNDTIKSIKAIVEKRQVVSVSTKTSNGITTKTIEYKSDNVQDDLLKYTEYLRNEEGFSLTKDMDLSVIPSTVELGKNSNDTGNLIMMTIDYNSFGYTITIQKGEGTLTMY
ncbi:MAG TPA: hypothetical protein OIM61_09065 [Clostridiaceae bacterium]|nr:hypothetical protein [Clostridiaceae bacterium]